MSNLATKIDHYMLALSMRKLRNSANTKTEYIASKKVNGAKTAVKFLKYFTNKKTREYFNKFRYNSLCQKKKERTKKHLLSYLVTNKIRSYFF